MIPVMEQRTERKERKKPRGPKKVTEKYLERVALWYLDRWGGASGRLRRLLLRRVQDSERVHGTDPEEGRRWIEALILRLQENGVLNDRLVAESRARSHFAKGQALSAVARKLRQDGLGDEDIQAAIERLAEERPAPNLEAAANYARRRRLGPYRAETEREGRRERDLAALARRGFDYQTARCVIEAESVEALEDLLEEAREAGL